MKGSPQAGGFQGPDGRTRIAEEGAQGQGGAFGQRFEAVATLEYDGQAATGQRHERRRHVGVTGRRHLHFALQCHGNSSRTRYVDSVARHSGGSQSPPHSVPIWVHLKSTQFVHPSRSNKTAKTAVISRSAYVCEDQLRQHDYKLTSVKVGLL